MLKYIYAGGKGLVAHLLTTIMLSPLMFLFYLILSYTIGFESVLGMGISFILGLAWLALYLLLWGFIAVKWLKI